MTPDSPQINYGPRFHRRSSGFKLAMYATLAGILGIILHFIGPAPRATSQGIEPSLAQLCAAVGAGLIWSAFLLNFLWGFTSRGRYYIAFFTALLIGAAIVFAIPPRYGFTAAVIVVFAGVLLFFYEFGLSISAGSGGIKRVRRFPIPTSREIPWELAESLQTDLRQITTFTRTGGRFGESENRLVVTGNGTRIAFSTTRYEAVRGDLMNQVEHARPFIVAATLQNINQKGFVQLGPIRIRREAIVMKRYSLRPRRRISRLSRIARRPILLPLDRITYATFEKGSLAIISNRKFYVPLRLVPNGLYFPDLLSALK